MTQQKRLTPQEESELLLQAQEAFLYYDPICRHCNLPIMECDCPRFDDGGNEI